MKVRLLLATTALVLALPAPAYAAESVHVALTPLNNSGATGTAVLTALDDGSLRVAVRATGMAPGAHAQHLHGSTGGLDFHCPDMTADRDGDGHLTTEEGMPVYGDIFVSLTTRGGTARADGLAVDRMPVADAKGDLRYDRTIAAADLPPGTVDHLADLHLVQHGVDANRNGRYDLGTLGESTYAKAAGLDGIPEEVTGPASCGMVSGAAAGSIPVGGVATGDGSTKSTNTLIWYAVSGLLLLGLVIVLRRRSYVLPAGDR